MGNVLTQVQGGKTTTYAYNVMNLRSRKTEPDSTRYESYTYDEAGRLLTIKDRKGVVQTNTWDVHGRLTGKTKGSLTQSFTYDNNGNQLTMTDAGGTTTRTYDALNRTLQKTVPTIGATAYQYDLTSGVTGLASGQWAEKTTDPKGAVTTRIYDKAGRLTQVEAGGQTFTYTYNAAGLRTKIDYPGGILTENYTYNNDQKLISLQAKKSTTAIKTDNYLYDAAHNPTEKREGTITTTYAFDLLNRLTQSQKTTGQDYTYTYDAAHNRTNDPASYTYDNNGNITAVTLTVNGASQTTNYAYDAFDRLTQVTLPNSQGTVKYTYNAEGFRITREFTSGSTTDVTNYLYEGDKVLLETDGSNNVKARNILGVGYLGRVSGSQTGFLIHNGQGDVVRVADDAGSILASYTYDPYGNIESQSGTFDNPIRYAEYLYDANAKLYYLQSRHYNPATGRFLTKDTWGTRQTIICDFSLALSPSGCVVVSRHTTAGMSPSC
jgi:RHS repeat-associated protein